MSSVHELRKKLEQQFLNGFEFDVGADNMALLTVIDASFNGKRREERLARILPLLGEAGLRPGVVELYTPDEAVARGITLAPQQNPLPPASWSSAVSMVAAGEVPEPPVRGSREPRRVVFYSYKGGVGRTTALVHTAFHLARAGQRVVLVDMDVEAPGLHLVLPRPDGQQIEAGLVDYLWERQVRPFDSATGEGLDYSLVEVEPGRRKGIAYSVEDPVSRARLHVVPAGVVGADYVLRLSDLSSKEVLTSSDDAWSLFEKELMEQLAPTIVLIDARTGLGDWGGLSLLRLAGEAFIVLYPSDQNREGVLFVRRTLRELKGAPTHLVLSPLPEGRIGKELVKRILPSLGLQEDDQPVEIHYHSSIAAAETYPVETAMADYAKIGNLLLESEQEAKVAGTIRPTDRWAIINSLQFPTRSAKDIAAGSFELFFQKTSDFEKVLDDALWVIRGRKGTGKSTLYHLFVEHKENAAKRARGRLTDIEIVSGHGPAAESHFRPTTDVFSTIQQRLAEMSVDWLSLWRAYAVVRLFVSGKADLVDSILKVAALKSLREHLQRDFPRKQSENWKSNHTESLLELVHEPLNGLCRDFIIDLNKALATTNKRLWLLYDDLDQDIQEESPWQGEALGGLLRLAYDSNNQDLHNIRFKIFLREDIWAKLVFTNKSHFGEPRTVLLSWQIEDFLRLAYRLATGDSALFRALAQRMYPVTDKEVDDATEEELRNALAPLWGMHQEKGKKAYTARWVYSRMTDASDNTYPRSLTVLLNRAKKEELNLNKPTADHRLLSPRALQAGLEQASIERLNELKNEYPTLKPFLDELERNHGLRSQFTDEELKAFWQQASKWGHPPYESFVDQLTKAGFLEKKSGRSNYDYGIASLYIDGLGISRVQGENK